ncbi:MAG: 2-oxo acid dehydrogenase subunit E2 [Flavobacteriales bacterium]|jgi:2-oxoglutarate dehydrogenase E2 component (dihydrolipoamide succinyltransferase)|nr:2-oxo acid dehydrogenase subunit E2 [Flavobacteriales bacterium]MBK6894097.1 2-oxo acid dehydrogenase subunit E2 [Flavobacteriales bacterium]MBK7248034.1 2-oxo acid dehydrogenase subunit E2 [Flavobacteriales bacterium]MBK7287718.1 2-oxo acid dehydrogenase subunit E2 [Flavobacteriales bacterium]MBK9059777.1 2-oxo acid dehydrogenase subunit E2 [Flavobacteriales bacterium]
MSQIEILLPKMGESVAEATIIKWLKNDGDRVEADEPLVEIATDKVDSEVPAPQDGILIKRLVKDGDVVQVGQPIAYIGAEGSAVATATSAAAVPAAAEVKVSAAPAAKAVPGVAVEKTGPSGKFYSPLVRNIAKSEGVSMNELEALEGSGQGGRVTKKDLLDYLPQRGTTNVGNGRSPEQPAPATAPTAMAASAAPVAPSIKAGPGDELIEMDRMRKLIADHMVMSKHISPHVTSFVEADVTNLVLWRNKVKNAFEKREGEKITFTPVFIMAIAQAIKEMPMINIQVDGTTIIKKKDINIGMAAALPSGNLIVPVVRNADRLNLMGLAKTVNDLARRARQGKLTPDEVSGGTYTVTNVGTFGNVLGTPIINQPQVAIMAFGAIQKKPAVLETPTGDVIAVRHMMYLSHSYDHRVVDGALGGKFVRRVADILEGWSLDTEI